MRQARQAVMAAMVCVLASACATATPSAAPSAGAATAAAVPAAAAPPDGCPLSPEDLSSASGLTFALADTQRDHTLETVPLKALVCVYTSSDRTQSAGDPLVLRVDTVTGPDAARLRSNFARTCTGAGGKVGSSTVAGAQICTRDGSVTEGNVAPAGDRAVDVYFVTADAPTAAVITPTFDRILAAVR